MWLKLSPNVGSSGNATGPRPIDDDLGRQLVELMELLVKIPPDYTEGSAFPLINLR